MKLRPLGNHILVEAQEKESVTASGIIIPDTADKERPERGVVMAVGEGKVRDDGTRAPIDVKVGDQVVFKKYAPDEVELTDGGIKKKYLILSADDVIAVIE